MRDRRFEPEAAGDGEVEVNALSVPHPPHWNRNRAVSESGDVKEERSVQLQMCEVRRMGLSSGARALSPRVDFVNRGRLFDCVTTGSLLRSPPSPLVLACPLLCCTVSPLLGGDQPTMVVAMRRSSKSDGRSARRRGREASCRFHTAAFA